MNSGELMAAGDASNRGGGGGGGGSPEDKREVTQRDKETETLICGDSEKVRKRQS